MSIIPFGLVGTIYGHAQWDVPLSMFSVVGMLGMIGIIINDSIVLVTTIDDHAKSRGLFPAIIDGAADRLRPVFLTTATTVLGLMPLLYEGSNQAEFLKPTIITLVYGLAFGMLLVLLIVPAIMAMQQDFGKQLRAARRALRSRPLASRAPAMLGSFAMAVLFAALIAPLVITGAPWPQVSEVLPMDVSGFGAAFGIYAAGLAIALLVIYAVSGLTRVVTGGRVTSAE